MYKYLTGLILIALFSCSDDQKPKGLIEKERFVEVLTDIRIMEAAYGVSFKQKDSVKVSINALYDSLFKSNNLSKEQFLDSYRFYSETANELSSIEDMVMEKLTNAHLELEQKLKKDMPADSVAVQDSSISN